MNGTQEPSASNFDHRIAQLDEGARRMMKYHSGTTLNTRISLLEALEGHDRHSPNGPVMKIHWKLPKNGRKPAMGNVECGICPQSGKFQKMADHIVCEHFNLTLWYCGLNSCPTSVSRKNDLARHRYDMHQIPRPRKAKEKPSQASHPSDFPPSSPTPSISPRPRPIRPNRSRSRSMEPSVLPSYSVGEIVNWQYGNSLQEHTQCHSIPSRQGAREGGNNSHTLTLGGGGYPNLVPPGTTLPAARVSPLPDESLYVFYPTHSRNSSYGLGIGISPDGARLFEQEAARKLLPSTPTRRVGPCRVFDRYSSEDFLFPPPRASTSSSSGFGLLPLPQPVHRVTTPIQTKSVQPGIYAPNLPERMHLPLPPSSPHNYSIHESSDGPMVSHPMTLSPQYYPPSSQINMPNAVPLGSLPADHWMPAFNTPPSRSYTPYPVDDDFAFKFGATDAMFGPRQ